MNKKDKAFEIRSMGGSARWKGITKSERSRMMREVALQGVLVRKEKMFAHSATVVDTESYKLQPMTKK